MPILQNSMVNELVKQLYQMGLRPDNTSPQQSAFLNQLFQNKLYNEQQYRQKQQQFFQNSAPTMVLNQQSQQVEAQKNENRLINMANMIKLAMQTQTLSELMQEYQGHKHEAKAKDHDIKDSNHDGSTDDDFSADVDGDGHVTSDERERFENFLVTKVEKTEPEYAKQFEDAQEKGNVMKGAEAGAIELMEQVVKQNVSLNNDAAAPNAAAKKPSSPFSNPFPTKPTPPVGER